MKEVEYIYCNSLTISSFLLESLSLGVGETFAKYLPYALILILQCLEINSGNELAVLMYLFSLETDGILFEREK